MIFLGKVGHETESVFVKDMMEKLVNGFSWSFHDMSGTTQEVYI